MPDSLRRSPPTHRSTGRGLQTLTPGHDAGTIEIVHLNPLKSAPRPLRSRVGAGLETLTLSSDMDRPSLVSNLRPIRRAVGLRYRKWSLDRQIPDIPKQAIAALGETSDVLLLCSRSTRQFEPQTLLAESAFAAEMAARSRPFAVADDPSGLFEKSVMWFLPVNLVSPRLWNYSVQVYEFAAGLERQGNQLFCSSDEVEFWENKAHMHRRFDEVGIPTPRTLILTRENWPTTDFDIEPVLIKREHSAGSAGITHFATASEARRFVASYSFRPTESLIMQEVVRGATRDLRLTMVGDQVIESATYWRTKHPDALSRTEWTTTATTYDSLVSHGGIPDSLAPMVAEYLRKLGLRMAGIDVMWPDDDVSAEPLVLELSPYFQPNPPKPARYAGWTYKQYKSKPYIDEGYFLRQHDVFRTIAGQILDQALF